MRFITIAFSLASASLLASAAPVPVKKFKRDDVPSDVNLPTPDMFQIPGVNSSEVVANISAFVPQAKAMVDVDQSCSKNASDILGALTYALYAADMARQVQANDTVYQLFFLPEEVQSVQAMFGAMVNKNASDQKTFKVTCPAAGEYTFPNNANSSTDASQDVPQIRLGPGLFAASNTKDGQSGLLSALLQEMTHIPTFAKAANLQSCGDSASNSTGTCDIISQNDEKNPGKKYSDISTSPIELSVCLRLRWAAFKNQTQTGASQPPMATDQNAGSYSAFGFLYMSEQLASLDQNASGMFMMGMGLMAAMMQQKC